MSKHFRADGWLEFSAALPQSLSDALLAAGVLRKDLTFLSPGISPALLGAAEAYTDSLFCINKSTGAARAYAAILNFFDELAGSTTPGVSSGNRKEMQRLERELKQRDAERKAAQRMRAEEHRRRREANEKKNEVVQIITNTRKLKRLSKRQMRDIRPVMDSSILEKKSV